MIRAAIIGGGIGGLATAIALRRAGVAVDIYEQAPAFVEIGAGIGVFPNAMRVLDQFGLRPAVERRGYQQTGLRFYRWQDGRVISAASFEDSEEAFGAPYFTMHRAHLLEALLGAVPTECLHLEHCLESLEQDGRGVRLSFANGKRVTADVVLGADGIRSPTARLVGIATRSHASGYAAYRTVVPVERVEHLQLDEFGSVWLGPGKHFAHFWIDRGRLLNVICYVHSPRDEVDSWTAVGDIQVARAFYADWHPTVRGILDAADQALLFGLYDRPARREWHAGRVALVGDAAHPMLPFYAQGAAQAIEDAASLGVLLAERFSDEVPSMLACYSALRCERVRRVQEIARSYAVVNNYPDGPEQEERDRRLGDPSNNAFAASGWLYGHDAVLAAQTAILSWRSS